MSQRHFLCLLFLNVLIAISGSLSAWGAVASNAAMIFILCVDAICDAIKSVRGEAKP